MRIQPVLALLAALLLPLEAAAIDLLKKAREIADEVEASVPGGQGEEQAAPAGSSDKVETTQGASSSGKARTVTAKAGFTVVLPAGWKVGEDEPGSFRADLGASPGVSVSVVVNDYGDADLARASRKANLDRARQEAKDGSIASYEEVKLGDARGVQRIENAPGDAGDPQRITVQAFAGTVGVNVVAGTDGRRFERNREALLEIVDSMSF